MRVAEQLLALGSFSSSSVSTGRAAGGEGCVWEISGRHARYRGGRRRLSGRRVSASSRRAASCGAAEEPTDLQPRAPVTVPASRRGVCDAHTETTLPAARALRQRRQRSVRRQLAWQADLAHTRPVIVRRAPHRSVSACHKALLKCSSLWLACGGWRGSCVTVNCASLTDQQYM